MTEQDKYKALLGDLQSALQSDSKKPDEAEDKRLNNIVASRSRDQDVEYDRRNSLYSDLLSNYIQVYRKKEKAKSVYKGIFFSVTMLLFCCVVAICLYGMYTLSTQGGGNLANVGIAIANIAGIVSALIVLPKIIAEHLFPVNEESNMIDMVKNMQDNDANIRDVLFKEYSDEEEREQKNNKQTK